MKKIIIGLFAFAFFFVGTNAFASGPFNGQSGDCPSIAIGNYTTGAGIGDGEYRCWTRSSVSAGAGDTINVVMWYHNNTNNNLTNVRGTLSQSTSGPANSYSFTGTMKSDQGNTTLGTVNLNLTSSQTLTYSSVHWMKDKQAIDADADSALPFGQSPSIMKNGGEIRLGDVPPGWNDYGELLIVFKVGSTAQTCKDSSANNNGGALPCTYDTKTPTGTISTNPSTCTIPQGSSSCTTTITWNTVNPVGVSKVTNPTMGTIANENSDTRQRSIPYGTHTFFLYNNAVLLDQANATASCASNSSWNGSTCTSNNNNNNDYCTISNFTANGSTSTTIQSGNAVRISWDTDGCTSVNVTGPNFNSSSLSDSRTISPSSSGTYTLRANGNNGGTQTRTVYVNVNRNNDNDNDNNNYDYCTISNFTANGSTSTTIQSGNAVYFVWNTSGCNSVNVTGPNLNSSSLSDSRTISPSSSGTYTLRAYGNNGGTQTRTVYVNVNQPIVQPYIPQYIPQIVQPYIPQVVVNDCAVTTIATNVTQTSAILNGLLTNATGASYFEYGTTTNLGSRTNSRNGNGSFNEVISNLAPNTIYYYRFVSQCGNGLSYGKIEIFRTQGVVNNNNNNNTRTIIRQVVVQGNTVTGTESPIMLKIENRYQQIGLGDIIDYTVTYKNIGKSILRKPVLQVVVPKGLTIINASRGTYSIETNTLTAPLEDLIPNVEGVVYLQSRVDEMPIGVAQIVTTAVLVYTTPNGAQENAIAYVLNSPKEVLVNNLGASAFWSGLWGMGLIGWLLLLILILLIILLTRRYYGNTAVVRTVSPTGNTHTTTTNY